MKAYDYNGVLLLTEDDVDMYIENEIGGNYNNIDVTTTWQFEECWNDVDEIEVEANSFDTFKEWCYGKGLNPSHYDSLKRYLDDLKYEGLI